MYLLIEETPEEWQRDVQEENRQNVLYVGY